MLNPLQRPDLGRLQRPIGQLNLCILGVAIGRWPQKMSREERHLWLLDHSDP
jgi:hypothetical protein